LEFEKRAKGKIFSKSGDKTLKHTQILGEKWCIKKSYLNHGLGNYSLRVPSGPPP
jgi:hypothetical protein